MIDGESFETDAVETKVGAEVLRSRKKSTSERSEEDMNSGKVKKLRTRIFSSEFLSLMFLSLKLFLTYVLR